VHVEIDASARVERDALELEQRALQALGSGERARADRAAGVDDPLPGDVAVVGKRV
jgi:hypothetical protein